MKKIVLFVALTVVMSACVKTTEPTRFSILGDSYSAFDGYVDPDTNDPYVHYPEIGVTGIEQMWWRQVADSTGWLLDRNNSFSGALICNSQDFQNGSYYGPNSFIRRMNNLGNPDVIFVFGATNDACVHDDESNPVVPLGDYVYKDWTEEQLCTFRPACAYLFANLQSLYPKAKIYFLLDMDLGSGGIDVERRDAFIESIHNICNHYNVNCIDLYYVHKVMWHPGAEGQKDIADQVLEYLASEGFNV